jgi:hypothetical protein
MEAIAVRKGGKKLWHAARQNHRRAALDYARALEACAAAALLPGGGPNRDGLRWARDRAELALDDAAMTYAAAVARRMLQEGEVQP